MAIFSVIDTTNGGDNFYEGMVKAAANFALLESEITDARDGQASVHAAIDLKVKAPNTNTADYVPQWNGTDSKLLKDGFQITAAGKALLDDANAAAQLTTLTGVTVSAAGIALLDDASADAQLTTLGVTAAAKTILDDANVAAIIATLGLSRLGQIQRSKFSYVDADTITIGPGVYHHSGTVDQIVYWHSTLTFDSNDTGTQWYYLYIDDSAVVTLGAALLTAAEFTNSTTAPTWSDAKHGWYNGNDRCIFAYHVTSNNIDIFYHDGGSYIQYGVSIEDSSIIALEDIGKTIIERTLTIPTFSTKANILAVLIVYTSEEVFCGPAVPASILAHSHDSDNYENIITEMITSSSQKIYFYATDLTGNYLYNLRTNGWYFPTGM